MTNVDSRQLAPPKPHLSTIDVYGTSAKGRRAARNTDRILITSFHRALQVHTSNVTSAVLPFSSDSRGMLFVIADGVGPITHKREANDQVALAFARHLVEMPEVSLVSYPERTTEVVERVRSAFLRIIESLRAEVGYEPTVTAALAIWPKAIVVHTGSSRMYQLIGEDLVLWTTDGCTEPEIVVIDLKPDADTLFCTDGVTRYVDDSEIRNRLRQGGRSEDIAMDLVRLAFERGGEDNASIIVAKSTKKGSFSPEDPLRVTLERAVGSQYEVLGLVGRGGMGAVYHARDRALDRDVAIKVHGADAVMTDETRERFLREARTAARLTHPNIVPLLSFGEAFGLVFYVMGYVDGESLDGRLSRTGPMPPLEAAKMLEDLARALGYAHEHGVIHRDVKPENVLLDQSGAVALTDFGIAKDLSREEKLTAEGLLVGTPAYMSPEQACGDRNIDRRSDIYSLGLTAFTMLSGKPAFTGRSVPEILGQQLTREAPLLGEVVSGVPHQLEEIVSRALKKTADERWQTAAEMANALADYRTAGRSR